MAPHVRLLGLAHPSALRLAAICLGLVTGWACNVLDPPPARDACRLAPADDEHDVLGPEPVAITIVAHRGFAACFPENTVEAVVGAASFGAQTVELDVQMSRDTVPVIMHDSTVDRTTDGFGRVEHYTLHELRRLDACPTWSKRCSVPTLDEVLHAGNGHLRFVLDLKGRISRPARDRIMTAIAGAGDPANVLLLTGNLTLLQQLRREYPRGRTAFVYFLGRGWEARHSAVKELLTALEVPEVVMYLEDLVKYPRLVGDLTRAGFEVTAATVRSTGDLRRLSRTGVRQFLSDVPLPDFLPPEWNATESESAEAASDPFSTAGRSGHPRP